MNEMERIEEELHSAYERVWESMSLWKCNKSNLRSMDPQQRTCSVEKSLLESIPTKKTLIEQTVNQGNIHEPEFRGTYSFGEDLWRQPKRIQLPVFTGDKRSYRN